jgi:CheY-like chemotaxis protein
VAEGSKLVLIVENDPPVRAVIEFTLERLGVEIIEAGNLTEARKQLSSAPDLVILDFYLEPEAGPDILDDMRPDVPVILLTASVETKLILDKYPRINAALEKPFEPARLRAVAAYLLGIPDLG